MRTRDEVTFGHALGDFTLKHKDGAVIPRRPRLDGHPGDEQRRGNVVGQIGDYAHGTITETAAGVERQRICRHDVEPAGIAVGDLAQGGDRPFVALDRDDARGAERQQCARQAAWSGTDFEDRDVGERACGPRDAGG
jgi:hypothetical protein